MVRRGLQGTCPECTTDGSCATILTQPLAAPPDAALKPTPPQNPSEAIGQDIAPCRESGGQTLLEHFNRIGQCQAAPEDHREGRQPCEPSPPGEHTREAKAERYEQ